MSAQYISATTLPGWHLPTNAVLHGATFDRYLRLNLWIALALLALLHLILIGGLLIRRRAHRPSDKLTLEYIPLAFFTLLFSGLALKAQQLWAEQRFTGADPSALQVEATGMQFAWYFRYPGKDGALGKTSLALVSPAEGNPVGLDPTDSYGHDDLVRSQLVLPAGREVDVAIRSIDVIHGFSVPELRLKQNAVPGETVHIHFTPAVPGSYAILCTQVCGLGHYRMQATLKVLSQADFATWLVEQERTTHDASLGSSR